MKADTVIELHNKGKKDFEGVWDSKPFIVKKGSHTEVVKGLADHFIENYPTAELEIKEIEIKEVADKRKPVNPLKENNRGDSFTELE